MRASILLIINHLKLYHPNEGQECFEGTLKECEDFVLQQGSVFFMYKIVPKNQQ